LLNAFDNLLFAEFQARYFQQTDGLAMGVPAAPDVAQLYCAFEESNEPAFKNTNILLFRRYIDDILVLLIAEDRASAMEQLSTLRYHKLEVIWEVDDVQTTFLDLTIMMKDGATVFKPYRKPLNHYERLPFSSSHPLTVKRGAFLGEMSRMARLCGFERDYKQAILEVRDIYLTRGYPAGMLKSWIKNNHKHK
jgi:hypothetical protein